MTLDSPYVAKKPTPPTSPVDTSRDAELAEALAFSLMDDRPPVSREQSERSALMAKQEAEYQAALLADQQKLQAATATTTTTTTKTSSTTSTTTPQPATVDTDSTPPALPIDDIDTQTPLPAEPAADAADAVNVRLTLPSGERVTRRFEPTANVGQLRAVARSLLSDDVREFDLRVPRSAIRFDRRDATLVELDLLRGAAITVVDLTD